jgi:hypothetical protein
MYESVEECFGVQRAELSPGLIQKSNRRRLLRTQYVLHWPGRTQEDDQLLREGSYGTDPFGRHTGGNTGGAGQ